MATQANFTRRHDLFTDAGFVQPDDYIRAIAEAAAQCGMSAPEQAANLPLSQLISTMLTWTQAKLPPSLQPLTQLSADFLMTRGGDLAGLLWLARQMKADLNGEETAAFLFSCIGVLSTYEGGSKHREAAAILRFLAALDFDYGDIYKELGVAYGFFQNRDPNPFVWKIRSFFRDRARASGNQELPLDILELGCGIGNDAQGFFTYPHLRSYVGTDISEQALTDHRRRSTAALKDRPDIRYELRNEDFLALLQSVEQKRESLSINLIYSYSSLHYFNSAELSSIFALARNILARSRGFFAFAIKGEGSIWDGQGVPLYRPDVWINLDGQSRWFPSVPKLREMVTRMGFSLVMHAQHEHWSYSEVGEPDMFHYCVCTPEL